MLRVETRDGVKWFVICEGGNEIGSWQPGGFGLGLATEFEQLQQRLAEAEEVMKAAASLPGEMWFTGQLALAEWLEFKAGPHLKYARERYEAAKAGGRE